MTLKKGLESVRGVYAITPFFFVSVEGLQPVNTNNKAVNPRNCMICFILSINLIALELNRLKGA